MNTGDPFNRIIAAVSKMKQAEKNETRELGHVTFRVPTKDLEKFEQIAIERGYVTKSEYFRHLIKVVVRTYEEEKKETN